MSEIKSIPNWRNTLETFLTQDIDGKFFLEDIIDKLDRGAIVSHGWSAVVNRIETANENYLEDAFQDGYNIGYDEGQRNGYDEGWEDAKNDDME